MSLAVNIGIQVKCNMKTAAIGPFGYLAFLLLAFLGISPFCHWPHGPFAFLTFGPFWHRPFWPVVLVAISHRSQLILCPLALVPMGPSTLGCFDLWLPWPLALLLSEPFSHLLFWSLVFLSIFELVSLCRGSTLWKLEKMVCILIGRCSLHLVIGWLEEVEMGSRIMRVMIKRHMTSLATYEFGY